MGRDGYTGLEMTKTVSFVARDELAEWLEQEAEEQMTSISAVCQQVVAEEYRRRETEDEKEEVPGGSERVGHSTSFEMRSKHDASEVRKAFEQYLSDEDDARYNEVHFSPFLPRERFKELERRSID
jgi:hypothetical protein